MLAIHAIWTSRTNRNGGMEQTSKGNCANQLVKTIGGTLLNYDGQGANNFVHAIFFSNSV